MAIKNLDKTQCPKCHKPTTRADYHKNAAHATGLAHNCKECMKLKSRQHAAANKAAKRTATQHQPTTSPPTMDDLI